MTITTNRLRAGRKVQKEYRAVLFNESLLTFSTALYLQRYVM
jgi:hypothetical protein